MNFELHTVRCAAQLLKEKKEKAELDYFNSMQSRADLEATKAKKNKKKKKPHQKENIGSEDDFDSLCEQIQSLDKVCNFPRCKTLVATLGVTCKFCGVRWRSLGEKCVTKTLTHQGSAWLTAWPRCTGAERRLGAAQGDRWPGRVLSIRDQVVSAVSSLWSFLQCSSLQEVIITSLWTLLRELSLLGSLIKRC